MSKRKLLLADDSITIQKVVNLTFADEGIEVISVGDGNSAMDKLREDSPDLVMADVNMPGLNGYEICERIKQTEGNGRTPVILLVGSFEPFDEDEARRVGADDYLTKPFQSISQLVEKVSGLLHLEENLEDTAEMPFIEPEIPESNDESEEIFTDDEESFEDFSDGFDDEMIHTEQIGSLPIDESIKFETPKDSVETEFVEDQAVEYETAIADFQNQSESAEDSESEIPFNDDEEDLHQTQPLSLADYQELSLEEPTFEEKTDLVFENTEEVTEPNESINHSDYSFGEFHPENEDDLDSDAEIESEFTESNFDENDEDLESIEEETELPMPEMKPSLLLDEGNLLDLPPLEGIEEDTNNEVVNQPTEDISTDSEPANELVNELKDDSEAKISEDLVEEIVRRVVDRLSDKAVREVAWEVVPDMADLIIKQMAEEKIKE